MIKRVELRHGSVVVVVGLHLVVIFDLNHSQPCNIVCSTQFFSQSFIFRARVAPYRHTQGETAAS